MQQKAACCKRARQHGPPPGRAPRGPPPCGRHPLPLPRAPPAAPPAPPRASRWCCADTPPPAALGSALTRRPRRPDPPHPLAEAPRRLPRRRHPSCAGRPPAWRCQRRPWRRRQLPPLLRCRMMRPPRRRRRRPDLPPWLLRVPRRGACQRGRSPAASAPSCSQRCAVTPAFTIISAGYAIMQLSTWMPGR